MSEETVSNNIERLRERVALACAGSGRQPGAVDIIAVSKTFGTDRIREAYDAGMRLFGENRVQEARDKSPGMPEGISLHLIGHLQSNKAKYVPGLFDTVQSVDSLGLAAELDKACAKKGALLKVLIQVKSGDEASKSGVKAKELEPLVQGLAGMTNIKLSGLMTIAPLDAEGEKAAPYFRKLYSLFESLRTGWPDNMKYLSMGMSGDFEYAIREGANMIRVGSLVFGGRSQKAV